MTEAAEEEPAEEEGGLKKRALRGSVVTLLGQLGGNGIRLASNLILTRLLLPEHFGVMALVNVTLTGLHMFSDIGIGPNVIQHPRGEERSFLHTAFSIQALRGFWLTLAGFAVAWPVARFYEIDELLWLIPLASLTAIIDGLTSTKIFRENRNLRLGRLTAIELASQLVAAIAMAITAWITRSVISLVIGGLVGGLCRTILSHLALPGFRDGFAWEEESKKAIVTFGRWIFLSTAITFVSMQVDRLVLGKLVDTELLGIYSIAAMIAAVPREVLAQLTQKVLYPVVAELKRGESGGPRIRRVRTKILAILILPMGFLAGEGDAIFDVLYDERYAAGGILMMIISVGAWLHVLESTYGVVVLAAGKPKWISFGTGLKAVTFLALSYPIYLALGIHGVAGLIAVSELGVLLMVGWGARSEEVTSPIFDVMATAGVLATIAAVYFAQRAITALVGTPWVGLVVMGLAVGGISLFALKRAGLLGRLRGGGG